MSYDERCLQLAAYFLDADTEKHQTMGDLQELAQRIQDTVEQFIGMLQPRKPR